MRKQDCVPPLAPDQGACPHNGAWTAEVTRQPLRASGWYLFKQLGGSTGPAWWPSDDEEPVRRDEVIQLGNGWWLQYASD